MTSLGRRFAAAIADRDRDGLRSLLAVDEDEVADTSRVAYRFEMECLDGPRVAQQQAYYRPDGGRIAHLRILCSGFRPR